MSTSIYSHPDLKAAEEKLTRAGEEAYTVACRARREPKSSRVWDDSLNNGRGGYQTVMESGQPTIARLRHPKVDRVKRILWEVKETARIKYTGTSLAHHMSAVLIQCIEILKDTLANESRPLSDSFIDRVTATILAFQDAIGYIEKTHEEVQAIQNELKEAEQQRFAKNQDREHHLTVRVYCVAALANIMDNLTPGADPISIQDCCRGIDHPSMFANEVVNLAAKMGLSERVTSLHEYLTAEGKKNTRGLWKAAEKCIDEWPMPNNNGDNNE